MDPIPGLGEMGYVAVTALVINAVIAVVGSLVLDATKVSNGPDGIRPRDVVPEVLAQGTIIV